MSDEDQPTCVKCGHDQIGLDGTCEFYVAAVDDCCGCQCVFPAPELKPGEAVDRRAKRR